MDRRGFLRKTGAATIGALSVSAVGLDVARAPDAVAVTYDSFIDQGGQLFNVKSAAYGATGDGTTDDTAAILSAFAAAGQTGTVYFPAGTYKIMGASNGGGPIVHSGRGGIRGCGGRGGNSVLLCGDASAGLMLNGCARYEGIMIDGNSVATAPLRTGTVVSSQVSVTGAHATFIDVWAKRSAGVGWGIYGARHTGYYHCGTTDNATDGLYIDGGAQGLDFFHFRERGNLRYGIHGDDLIGATASRHVRFYSAYCEGHASRTSVSKVYLRGALEWSFPDSVIEGTCSGPTVDLNQSSGYGIDLCDAWISGDGACIKISGAAPAAATRRAFVRTGGCTFESGTKSVEITGDPGVYHYSAVGGWSDDTTSGAVAAAGLPAVDTCFNGRTGRWQTAAVLAPWSGTLKYRFMAEGWVEFKGSVLHSGVGSGPICNLPVGYRPDGSTRRAPSAAGTIPAVISVTTGGAVSADPVGTASFPASATVHLDAVSFAVGGV